MAGESEMNKVVLVGDVGVGKTTIFTRFMTGKPEGNTHKVSEHEKTLTVDGEETSVSVA